MIRLGRRAALLAAAGLVLGGAGPMRVAVLDWGLTETCLALGLTPIGVPAPRWYDRYAVEPPMPAGVADVGLLFAPNFEVLLELAPDAILIPPALQVARPMLERIAPVIVSMLYRPVPNPYAATQAATRQLAAALGLTEAGEALVARTEAALEAARATVAGQERAIYLGSLIDTRHVNLFGIASLELAVLERLGLRAAWAGASAIRGEFATVGIEQLAGDPQARIIDIPPALGSQLPAIAGSTLWQALPAVRAGRVQGLAPVLSSGGLPAVARLARLLAEALPHGKA